MPFVAGHEIKIKSPGLAVIILSHEEMASCRGNFDCGMRELCSPSSKTCVKARECLSQEDCALGFECHRQLQVCVPISCTKTLTACPQGTFCNSDRLCQAKRGYGELCTSSTMCGEDAICWKEQCRKRCSPDNKSICPTGLECRNIQKLSQHICISPRDAAMAAAMAAPRKQADTDDGNSDSETFKIFIMTVGCLLGLCVLLFIFLTLFRRSQRKSSLHDLSSLAESGMIEEPRPFRPPVPPRIRATDKPSESDELPLDVIQEEDENKQGRKSDHESIFSSQDDGPSVDTSPSPSVSSVKEIWEQRGRIIVPARSPQSPLNRTEDANVDDTNETAEESRARRIRERRPSKSPTRDINERL